jgi:hypothetical protein
MQRAVQDTPTEEFSVPQNAAPVLVNYVSGRPTTSDDKDAIREFVFK